MFWINFDKILIFPFKISEYHWGAELMFNIKRINARVIQLASDLCSYTSSGFGGQLQWGEGEGGPGLQASVWAESRNSTEQLLALTSPHCSTAALQHCTAASVLRTMMIFLDFHFHQYSVNLEILSIIHWYCTLSVVFTVQDWVPPSILPDSHGRDQIFSCQVIPKLCLATF